MKIGKIVKGASKGCDIFVFVGRHNDNSFIVHQSFANANPYEAAYILTLSLTVLKIRRNNNNGALSIRKPYANSNKASMSSELCAFQDEIKYGREDTFGTNRPFGKSAMIKSNPPNL